MAEHPLATIALTIFNHERFVRAAIESAFAQDYSPLEIIVSDDASSDRTAAIAQALVQNYTGLHDVRFSRNETNLGVGAHTDKLGAMARGEVVLLAAGDDIDRPDRVSRVMAEYAAANGRAMAISAPAVMIDEEGHDLGTSPPTPPMPDLSLRTFVLTGFPLRGPAAYSARVFREFAPMGAAVLSGEDLVLPLRAALLGEVRVLLEPVSFYRQHGASLMGSAGLAAPSAGAYRRGLRRFLGGVAAARQAQLRDFNAFTEKLDTPIEGAQKLQCVLRARARQAGAAAAIAAGHRSANLTMLRCLAAGQMSLRDFIKTVAMTNAPSLWYRYIKARSAAIGRAQERR